jgi:nucleotide-binding universal stress UspA family protein
MVHAKTSSMSVPKKILVATDFSETAEAACAEAFDIAKAFDAKVSIVHVYELPTYPYQNAFVTMSPEFAAQLEETARTALESACKRYATGGVEIEPLLREGNASHEILRAADDRDVDLIVIGTGHTGFVRRMLGSVAEKIVRTARHSVLVVPKKT